MEEKQIINEDKVKNREATFMGDITYWNKRLKSSSFMKFIYVGITVGLMIFSVIASMGIVNYFMSENFFSDVIILMTLIFSLYLGKQIPDSFRELILENKDMFYLDETYLDYLNLTEKNFSSKMEFIFPLFVGIVYTIITYGMAIMNTGLQYLVIAGESVPFPNPIIGYINYSLGAFQNTIVLILAFSTLMNAYFAFKCISKLGTEQYPLSVSYKELKTGAFNEIGKYIISLSIPIIILSTGVSILGLITVFIMNNALYGFFYMILGLIIVSMMSLLLYKNTTDIHEAIAKYKDELKDSVISHIQIILSWPKDEVDFHQVYRIKAFLDEVDDIRDWPFNPTSIKKLVMALGTSFVPILFSLLGVGFGG